MQPDGSPAPRAPRSRRKKVRAASAVLLAVLVAAGLVVRTQWFAHRVAQEVEAQLHKATGLEVSLGSVGFSPLSLSVKVRDIRVGATTSRCRPLVTLDTLEVVPSAAALLRGQVNLQRLMVDGGRLDLRFDRVGDHVALRCGPVSRGGGSGGRSELPFRDVAVSDLTVHVEHPALGTIDLSSADLDVVNLGRQRLMIGLLAVDGRAETPYFTGALPRAEARLSVDLVSGDLRVALANVVAGNINLQVREGFYIPSAHRAMVDAHLEAPIPDLLRLVPPSVAEVPRFQGQVVLDVRGEVGDLARADETFSARGALRGIGLAMLQPDSTTRKTLRYNLGDSATLRFDVNRDRLEVRDLHASYAGAELTTPVLTLGLRDHFALESRLRIDGLDFTQLMHDVTITPRTKVMWTLSGPANLRGTLDPLRLVIDLPDMDTRDFSLLRDYFIVLPHRPLVHIPRAHIGCRMEVDPTSVSWNDCVATFGQSRVQARRIRVRTAHDRTGRERDLLIEGLVSQRIHLQDIGHLADLPIGGDAAATLSVDSDTDDVVLTGTARIENFSLATFPFGTLQTPPGQGWRMQGMRVTAPIITGSHRQSHYELHDPYLDFSRYSLAAGAHVQSPDMRLQDFYNMFHFEGDPTFTPYDGTGQVDAQVDYVLGRPGDDRDGVMTVDARIHHAQVLAFGEHLTEGDAHVAYSWLRRRDGVRGARISVEHFTARKGVGAVDASGWMDLGARMHFVAGARDIPLGAVDMVRAADVPVSGTVSALFTVEGTPDAPRYDGDVQLDNLVVIGRPLGSVSVDLTQTPEGAPARGDERPPVGRIDVGVRALDERLRLDTSLHVPWEPSRWRDATGVDHTTWERAWGHSVATAALSTRGPLDLLPWLPPTVLARLGENPSAQTALDVTIDRVRLDTPAFADGRVLLRGLDLRAYDLPFTLAQGKTLAVCLREGAVWIAQDAALSCDAPPVDDGTTTPTVDTSQPMFLGPDGARMWLAGSGYVNERGAVTGFNLTTRAEADLSRLAARVPQVTWGRGTGVLQVHATGDLAHPNLTGLVELNDAALGTTVLPSPISDLALRIRLQGTEAIFDRAHARYGAGTLDLTEEGAPGVIRFAGTRLELLDIPIIARGISLAPTEGAEVSFDVDARLRGDGSEEIPVLQGVVNLTRAMYSHTVPLSADLAGRLQRRGGDAPDEGYDPSRDRVRLDLTVRSAVPMRVVNNLGDIDLRFGEDRPFRVSGTMQRPGVVGTINVTRGFVRAYETEFEVRRGRVEFDNPDRVSPTFDVAAQTEIRRTGENSRNQWRVNLHASGTPDQFTMDLSADPALSQEDIILLLIFRLTRAELDRVGAGNTGQAVAIEVLSRTLGLDRVLRDVLPMVDDVRFGSAYNPRSNRTEPQMYLGTRLLDWLRVGGAVTASDQPQARLTGDIRIGQQVSAQAFVENASNQFGSLGANVGLDLRWRMEFQ